MRTGIPEYGERLLKVNATRRVFDPKHPGELVAGEPLFEELLSCVALCPAGFKLCLVSPELQGRDAHSEIPALAKLLNEQAIAADAVCTKRTDLWEWQLSKA